MAIILLRQCGDASNKPSILRTCKVTIPELFTINSRTLSWDSNSEAAAQSCALKIKNAGHFLTGAIVEESTIYTLKYH